MSTERRPADRAFTLLELCIVMALAVLLMAVAVPALSGQLARQKLQSTFDRFDALVADARKHSVADGKPYILVWKKGGVYLYPADESDDDRRKNGPTSFADYSGSASGTCSITRLSSLTATPAPVWTFWPTGNCEPVTIRYEGPGGKWEAAYNGLSSEGTFNTFIAQ